MGSFLPRVVIGVGVALALLLVPGSGISGAQPDPGGAAPASASTRAAAKKLVDEGIAAFDAKDYDRAIALYL
jgi:hypothetical protein